jgi:iron complex outermembrane recepter protein
VKNFLGISGVTAVLAISVVLQAFAPRANAQESDSGTATGGLQEVVITARLRSEAESKSPTAIVAISGIQLEQQGITQVDQLEIDAPGIMIQPGFIIDTFYIRGIGTQPINPGLEQSVGLFIDGVSYGSGHWINQGYFDVQSADVLKGPQGVYFGANTDAGAIQITTRNPTRDFEGYVKAGYEYYADERYVESVVSGPLSDTLTARVAVRADKMAGWMFDDPAGIRSGGNEDYSGRITLAWDPTSSFNANLKFSADQYKDDGPVSSWQIYKCTGNGGTTPQVLGPFGTSGTDDCRFNYHTSDSLYNPDYGTAFSDYNAYAATLTTRYQAASGELTSITAYNHYELDSLGSDDLTTASALWAFLAQSNGVFSEELRYQTKFSGPLNFIVGGYYNNSDFDFRDLPGLFPIAFQGTTYTFDHVSSQRAKTYAGFADIEWKIANDLSFDVGGRYSEVKKDSSLVQTSEAAFVGPIFTVPPTSADQSFSNFSPQATLTWTPNQDLMVYGAYKTGFKAGGFNHLMVTVNPGVPDTFGSEKVEGGELGTKFYMLDHKAYLTLDTYYYKYKDLQVESQVSSADGNLVFVTLNAASVTSKGVEFSGVWEVLDGLRLSGAANYNDTAFDSYPNAPCYTGEPVGTGPGLCTPTGTQNLAGAPTPYAAKWTTRLAATYDHSISGNLTLRAGVGADYSSGYQLTTTNRPDALIGGYWLYDANVSIATRDDRWTVALLGRNLSGQTVPVNVSERAFSTTDKADLIGQIQRGRQIELQGTWRF